MNEPSTMYPASSNATMTHRDTGSVPTKATRSWVT